MKWAILYDDQLANVFGSACSMTFPHARLRGGQFFPELTPAQLAGATLGGSFCKMRGIYAGFRMEINANGQRTVTTPVESIGILV